MSRLCSQMKVLDSEPCQTDWPTLTVKPRAKAGLRSTTSEWSTPSRVPETHPACFSITGVDPPCEFQSLNFPSIKCRSLIRYVYLAYFWNIGLTNVAITVCMISHTSEAKNLSDFRPNLVVFVKGFMKSVYLWRL